jgi:hypothetical protein
MTSGVNPSEGAAGDGPEESVARAECRLAPPDAYPPTGLLAGGDLSPGPFVAWVVRVVERRVVIAGVPDGAGGDSLLQLFDV